MFVKGFAGEDTSSTDPLGAGGRKEGRQAGRQGGRKGGARRSRRRRRRERTGCSRSKGRRKSTEQEQEEEDGGGREEWECEPQCSSKTVPSGRRAGIKTHWGTAWTWTLRTFWPE